MDSIMSRQQLRRSVWLMIKRQKELFIGTDSNHASFITAKVETFSNEIIHPVKTAYRQYTEVTRHAEANYE